MNNELNAIIKKLSKKAGCQPEHHPLSDALAKGMPESEVLKAGKLWLSKDTKDWTEATNLIFQYTSYLGLKFKSWVQPVAKPNGLVTITLKGGLYDQKRRKHGWA